MKMNEREEQSEQMMICPEGSLNTGTPSTSLGLYANFTLFTACVQTRRPVQTLHVERPRAAEGMFPSPPSNVSFTLPQGRGFVSRGVAV